MPPFQYTNPTNPFALSIAQALENRGTIAAQGAERVGDIEANAQRQVGQAWGQAAQSIGQDVSGAIQTQADPRRKLAQQEVDANNRTLAYTKTAAGITQALTGPNGEAPDQDVVTGMLTKAGIPLPAQKDILAPLKSMWDSHKESLADAGAIAYRLMQTVPPGASADDRAHAASAGLGAAVAAGVVSKADAQKVLQGLGQGADPMAIAVSAMSQSPSGRYKDLVDTKPVTLAEGASLVNPQTGAAIVAGTPKPVNVTAGGTLVNPTTGAVVATGQPRVPVTKSLEAKPDMVIKGTTNIPTFNPADGSWTFNGQPVPADQVVKAPPVKDPMAQALQQVALETAQQNLSDKQRRVNDVQAIADGIKAGTIPPDPEGLQRNGLYGDVIAQFAKEGINFNELRQNYLAQKRLINTENSPQGVRLDVAVRSGLQMYDKVDELADQWKGMGIGMLSRANLKAATEGILGPKAQQLAVQLNGQISQLTSDIATVEQNGMTPTNEARDVASQSMQSWWGNGTIQKMTAQGRANMKIRDMARKETTPLVPGQPAAAPAASAPAAKTMRVVGPNGQTGTVPAGTALPAGWTAAP